MRHLALGFGLLSGLFIGCRDDFQQDCVTGSQGCDCTSGMGCDQGLVCHPDLNLCTEPGDGDGDGDGSCVNGDTSNPAVAQPNMDGKIVAIPVTAGCSGTLESLAVHALMVDGLVTGAVYDDNGGVPGSKIASAESDSVDGWVTLTTDAVPVQEGDTLWLAAAVQESSTLLSSTDEADGGYQADADWSGGNLPPVFPGGEVVGSRWAIYLQID